MKNSLLKMYLAVSTLFFSMILMTAFIASTSHAADASLASPEGLFGFLAAHKVAIASILAIAINELIAYNDKWKNNSLIQLVLSFLLGIKK